LKPYLPASAGEPAFYGDLSVSKNEEEIPCDLEAGYEAAQIRLMGFGKKDFSEFNHELGNSSVDKATMENIVQQKRQEQLDKQRREHKYHRFVEGNLILKSGLIFSLYF
jgi:hypothetical protein